MIFKHINATGTTTCSLGLSHLWADVYGLDQRGSGNCSVDGWAKLILQAVDTAKEKKAGSVIFRVIENSGSDQLIQKLPNLGFSLKSTRIEYRAFLADLPTETGSQLLWNSAADLQWTEQQIAAFLVQVSQGSPDSIGDEDPLNHISDWIQDPVLTAGLDCIWIGFHNDIPLALVVAQMNPRTLWSRISYMGLAPELRGRGLGKYIHLKGFQLLRQQGGNLYHGGTNLKNTPMIRLFELHDCHFYQRMQEWIWHGQ